ncbi:hypothetical protein M409DRAFT_29407 [Zasmidium cellare ATCC 36951]|uniref:F-box domain-containing protein n=1 Tax=Zasmidium cellare ATCC 36951 TaxID=1080233 RepID=A0A6A6C1S5_ZASCE|nr:uncharacterized protein M409DRAFT_29407 [Zasmidium cellare ATCC 36951]KAF2160110.1 hypothetical protein M409DRAFT_29407 [Zasmidium cellare ATCC 36951]
MESSIAERQAAHETVFHTPEILEIILDFLSFPDLSVCCLVSQRFLGTIESSLLQRKLSACETVQTETLQYATKPNGAFDYDLGVKTSNRKLSPLLSASKGAHIRLDLSPNCAPTTALLFSINDFLSSPDTWRRTYLTLPPIPAARLRMEWTLEHDGFSGKLFDEGKVESVDGKGLTFGELWDGLMAKRPWHYYSVHRMGARVGNVDAEERTVEGTLGRLEVLTEGKVSVVEGRCWVQIPRMTGLVE